MSSLSLQRACKWNTKSLKVTAAECLLVLREKSISDMWFKQAILELQHLTSNTNYSSFEHFRSVTANAIMLIQLRCHYCIRCRGQIRNWIKLPLKPKANDVDTLVCRQTVELLKCLSHPLGSVICTNYISVHVKCDNILFRTDETSISNQWQLDQFTRLRRQTFWRYAMEIILCHQSDSHITINHRDFSI